MLKSMEIPCLVNVAQVHIDDADKPKNSSRNSIKPSIDLGHVIIQWDVHMLS